MDNTDTDSTSAIARAQLIERLHRSDTKELIALSELFSDELQRRANTTDDPRIERLHRLGVVALVSLRGRLRCVVAHELGLTPPAVLDPVGFARTLDVRDPSPAVPVSDPQHGAAKPEAVTASSPRGGPTTTTGSAGGSVCILDHEHAAGRCVSLDVHRLHCALGCGLCSKYPLPYGRGTTPPSPRSSIAAAVAARAEGADGEGGAEGDARAQSSSGDRGELGKAHDLAFHLACLKGGRS